MEKQQLHLYNSLSREKEPFSPIHEGRVGMYVCGPTVYSNVHLGNCRTFISFDIIHRYLRYLGYQVRYVRNITDVGHLENQVDMTGEDRIAKQARLEAIEPMEVVQRYTYDFREVMRLFNTLPPSIEPSATGHILEQIEMVERILANGFAYVRNGSVYFKTAEFAKKYPSYGQLSGKVLDELYTETRELRSQDEKDHPADFAIWMKAGEQHIMRWQSPWGVGFPGWHLECSAMSTKYLGERFDIHGGGMDLKFPHHENEVAQNIGSCGVAPANYWLHTNMLTFEGTKMSKSLGNSILPHELFSGSHPLLDQAYSPMTVRFFMLQTHYRSTLDFSNEALKAAEKGFKRLSEGLKALQQLEHTAAEKLTETDAEVNTLLDKIYEHLNDDLNTPQALARIFEIITKVNAFKDKHLPLNNIRRQTLNRMKKDLSAVVSEVFGLINEEAGNDQKIVGGLMELLIDIRKQARSNKDWATSDKIRDNLKALSIVVKDGKEGTTWSVE